MYRLATKHSVTNGRTNRRTDRLTDYSIMPIGDHTARSAIG